MWAKHVSMMVRDSVAVLKVIGIYSCVSSAYRWYWRPYDDIMSAIGAVYSVYKIGPKTEPWGTPNARSEAEERAPSIVMY